MDLTGLGSIADLGQSIIQRIWPNKSDPAYITAQAALLQAQEAGALKELDNTFQLSLEQIKTDAVEAASPNMFIAGGRPFMIWVCGGAFSLNYLFGPLATWGAAIAGHPDVKFPQLDLTVMMPVLLGLLGLGTMRTVEKLQDAAGNH